MEEFNINIGKMSGNILHNENIKLHINKYKNIPFGFKNYNNKLCSDVERMITQDLEDLSTRSVEKNTKKVLKNLLILTRKYPTYYFYVQLINNDSDNTSDSSEVEEKNVNVLKNTGGYEFWFNLNNEKISISTYAEAMDLHLKLLKSGDYKMSEFFLDLSKKMTDNPTRLYQNSEIL